MKIPIAALMACAGIGASALRAQTPGALNQLDSADQRRQLDQSAQQTLNNGDSAPELYPGEADDVGPQSVLRLKTRRTYFEATADEQFFYTDNVLLQDHARIGTPVLVSLVQFALAPTPYDLWGGGLAPALGYRQQWFNYGLGDDPGSPFFSHLSDLNFNAQTFFGDLQWSRGGWTATAGLDYLRMMSSSDYHTFYQEYDPHVGLWRLISLNPNMAFLLGYEGDYHVPNGTTFQLEPDFNQRLDQGFFATYTQTLWRRVAVQPYYQFKYTLFAHEDSRHDFLNSLGISLYYAVCPAFNIRGYFGYDIRRSNRNALGPDYEALSAGGGVTFDFRF